MRPLSTKPLVSVILTISLATLNIFPLTGVVRAQGCNCVMPPLPNGWKLANLTRTGEGKIKVCVSGTYNSEEQTGIKAGFDYWAVWFANQDENAVTSKLSFEVAFGGTSDCAIKVETSSILDSSVRANATGLTDGNGSNNNGTYEHTASIKINENWLTSNNDHTLDNANRTAFWGMAIAQEVGHLQNFGHPENQPSCTTSSTVMMQQIPTNWTTPLFQNYSNPQASDLKCGDSAALTNKYKTDCSTNCNNGGGQEQQPTGTEDCFDVYLVTTYYLFDGYQWLFMYQTWDWLYSYCGDPLPEG